MCAVVEEFEVSWITSSHDHLIFSIKQQIIIFQADAIIRSCIVLLVFAHFSNIAHIGRVAVLGRHSRRIEETHAGVSCGATWSLELGSPALFGRGEWRHCRTVRNEILLLDAETCTKCKSSFDYKKKKKKEEELNTPQLSALLSGGWYNCYIWIGSHSIPRGWRWLCAMLNNAMFVHFMWVLVVVVPQSNLIIFAAPTTNFNYSSSCSSFQLKWPNTAHRLTVRSARKTCNKNHEEDNLFSFQNLFNIEI